MKVFPHFGEEQTFSLSKLASAVELIHTQNAVMDAHHVGKTQLLSGRCPACGTYIQNHSPPEVESPVLSVLSTPAPGVIVNPTPAATFTAISTIPATQAPSTAPTAAPAAVGPTPLTAAGLLPTTALAAVGPTPPTAAGLPTISATQTALVHQTSHWYVVTVGHEMGIFQGWTMSISMWLVSQVLALHTTSPLLPAQAAYSEAVNNGGIMEATLNAFQAMEEMWTRTYTGCRNHNGCQDRVVAVLQDVDERGWDVVRPEFMGQLTVAQDFMKEAEALSTLVDNFNGPCTPQLKTECLHLLGFARFWLTSEEEMLRLMEQGQDVLEEAFFAEKLIWQAG
ncbi:hypothetical protein DFH29DRAFT_1008432 [Suillus ampliporus]|nr:hypothetical protein DFH29DRAFT_1008432 [Suillus ampliporus]